MEEKKKSEEPVVEVEPQKLKTPKVPKIKDSADKTTDATLFVRNIGWDVDQEQFKKHME